jgi:hypothetical protein
VIHPVDPPVLHHIASNLGDAMARGETDIKVARDICRLYADAAPQQQVYRGNVSGLYVRLCHAASDRAADQRRRLDNARTAVRWAVRPLFERGARAAEIEDAAGRASGDAIGWDEIGPILRDEMQRVRNRRRQG